MKFSFSDMAMVFFLGIMTAVAPLAMDMYLPALPEVSEELHVSPSLAQLTLTAVMVGMALGQLVGGPLSDKMGRRRPALVGMALFALSSFLCTKTNSI
jgi:DHA1 family bicyclomycin/chloramphenicol resistance-like MFS transporter